MTDSRTKAILLSTLRGELGQASTEPSPLLSTGEWRKLLDLARFQGITPLLYQKIKEFEGVEIPLEISKELQDAYLQNLARNMQLYHQLKDILNDFHKDNIPAIPLKGAYLAEHVYDTIGVRSMNDIDILVKQEDLLHVENILMGMGFLPEQGVRVICGENVHFGYIRIENNLRMRIEVHWNLLPARESLPVDIDKIWEQSRASVISGVPVRELSPEDLLLHLAVHASKHVFYNGLRMVYDIAETAKHFENKIDWQHLEQTARGWGATKSLYTGLRLANELFFAPVPDSLMDAIRPLNAELSYHAILDGHLFAGNESGQTPRITPSIANIWTTKGISGKIGQLWQRLFPSRKVMALMYGTPPDSLRIFLYYPVRLKYLMSRYGQTVWRLVRRDELMEAGAERQSKVNELRKWLLSG